jgi:hypothetical protein
MGFARILDTTGWNLVYKSILYIPIILIGGVNLQDVFIAFHLDCYWSLEPCQLRLGLRLLKYILTIPNAYLASQ